MKVLTADTLTRIADLLAAGATNAAIARELGLDKATPARYRRLLGIGPAPVPPAPNRTNLTIAEAWERYTQPRAGGHREWTGRRATGSRTPVFTYRERTYTARKTAFQIAAGREPNGYVTVECDYADCVEPAHLADLPARTRVRAQLAAVLGRVSQLTECTRGHAVAEHRRYLPNGSPYCGTCQDEAHHARKAAA
ncbi:hypothetical protein ACIBKZ_09615 [Streptomyces sp. NPDC050421]|uniref:hypothetical protein n=1 Tax=Streptomyces sp. NPDC050421 TaxID=3365613 RepID=UPI00378B37D2